SPWGVGFPGWHIECSAMSMKALGETLDIHTGGIDHISIHHSNEIAQSEAATGKKFVNYWVHHNFLVVEGEKMSKSLGNFFTVQDVVDKGYDPLSLRYLYLQTHYRQEMNFTWDALDGAQKSLDKLRSHVIPAKAGIQSTRHPGEATTILEGGTTDRIRSQKDSIATLQNDNGTAPSLPWMKKFMDALNDDLNTAKALAVVWEMVKEDILPGEKKATLLEMDRLLGLDLAKNEKGKMKNEKIPDEVEKLMHERQAFRKAGDYKASDELRKKIEDLGFTIQDTKEGSTIQKK
ncbi:MAG TPA: DALR domain-containing protein, partial [Candidatus Eisenbacteria bacterium]|nr:DALR domain-containing protein [Candidatus Eisenbacteria bacterium]